MSDEIQVPETAADGTAAPATGGTAMSDDELRRLGADIVKSFHEQFAQNQNHHQKLFLQILTVLLTVLVGFGYIYVRVNALSMELRVTVDTLYVFLVLAVYLLSLGIALILNMALGFRRDQMAAANIRVKTGVMGACDSKTELFFPPSFNPVKEKRGMFAWMPEFHGIFLLTLIVVKVFLICGVLLNPEFQPLAAGSDPVDWLITLAIPVVFLSFVPDVWNWLKYYGKWVRYYEERPSRLDCEPKTPSAKPGAATPPVT